LGKTPVARFVAYLMVAMAVMGAAWTIQGPDTALAQWLTQFADIHLFGRRIPVDKYIMTLIIVPVPLLGAMAAEFLMSDGRHSILSQYKGKLSASRKLDLISYLLNFPPLLVPVLQALLTLGMLPLLNAAVRAVVPANVNLFEHLNGAIGLVGTIAVFIGLKSFIEYWVHRAFHSPFLWPMHRLHHAASEMNLLISYRLHPGSSFFGPLLHTLPMMLWGAPTEFLICYVAYNTFHEVTVHTNHDCDWGWIGANLLFAPISHKIHHSMAPEHRDKNFSSNLAIWDRLFGTYRHDLSVAAVGVDDPQQVYEKQSFVRILVHDMVDFGRNIKTALSTLGRNRSPGGSLDRGL
jgi:sterol desaturase/sphingolipid hydroxylase (fatty acid hydroxylase superfamily)